jgi:hypothetical protein
MPIQAPENTADLPRRVKRQRYESKIRTIASDSSTSDAVAAKIRIDSLGALEIGQPLQRPWNYYTRNSAIERKKQLDEWRRRYFDAVVESVESSVS